MVTSCTPFSMWMCKVGLCAWSHYAVPYMCIRSQSVDDEFEVERITGVRICTFRGKRGRHALFQVKWRDHK